MNTDARNLFPVGLSLGEPTPIHKGSVRLDIGWESDSAWLGELLSDRSFEFLFFKGQAVGRNEGPETSDTCPGAQWLSLEAAG